MNPSANPFAIGLAVVSRVVITLSLFLFASLYAILFKIGAVSNLCFYADAPNSIDADLKLDKVLDWFLEQFVSDLLPLNAFSTDLKGDQVTEGDSVEVGYIPAAAAARAFNGTYTIQKSDWAKKKVAIDRHEYVSWGLSDMDLYKGSLVNLEIQTRQKASALASAVITDCLGVVTAANFGAAVFTGAHGAFDLDDVADLRTTARKAKWPKMARNIVLAPDYYGNVVKGSVFQNANQAGGTQVRESGELPTIYNFRPYEVEGLPENDEHLVGFINMPSAIGVAMRYVKPRRPERYINARPVSDEKSGISFGFRQDYDTKTGVEAMIFEANWGRDVLETGALKRMVSE